MSEHANLETFNFHPTLLAANNNNEKNQGDNFRWDSLYKLFAFRQAQMKFYCTFEYFSYPLYIYVYCIYAYWMSARLQLEQRQRRQCLFVER